MGYLEARANLLFLEEYRAQLLEFWALEDASSKDLRPALRLDHRERQQQIAHIANSTEYIKLREYIAKNNLRVVRIAHKLGIATRGQSFPPPAVGGVVVNFDMFEVILTDNTWGGITRNTIYDKLQAIMGAAEQRKSLELRRMINPLYWISSISLIVLRTPFVIVQATGFNVEKFEDHFFGKFAKLLLLVAILFLLIKYFGFSKEELLDAVKVFKP